MEINLKKNNFRWKKLFEKEFNQFSTQRREILWKIRQEEKKLLRIYRNFSNEENKMEIEEEENMIERAEDIYDNYNEKFIKLLQKRRKNSNGQIISFDLKNFEENLEKWNRKMEKYYEKNSTKNFINWKNAFLICNSFRSSLSHKTNQILLKFKNSFLFYFNYYLYYLALILAVLLLALILELRLALFIIYYYYHYYYYYYYYY